VGITLHVDHKRYQGQPQVFDCLDFRYLFYTISL
jgi:hypothetical protein